MNEERNIADSLAEHLPKPQILAKSEISDFDVIEHVALPKGFTLVDIDNEKYEANPRRAKGTATLSTAESFIDYVKRYQGDDTVVWCNFDPQTFTLSFQAVFDDHQKDLAGWRGHRAKFTPATSAEWRAWKAMDTKPMKQLEFAEFIERNSKDIAPAEGFPTDLAMLKMATELELNGEKRIKSIVRIQGGGTRLDYVNDDDANTIEAMQAFNRFQIGIPVFWSGLGYLLVSSLKYRQNGAAVNFTYELNRADVVHERAAKDVITTVQAGIGETPMLMGAFD